MNGVECANGWNCGRVYPLPGVPMVRVVDEQGNELARGYYIYHVNRNIGPFCRYLKAGDVDHLVAIDGFADWNLPQALEIKKVTPPHRIEVLAEPKIDRDAMMKLADRMERMSQGTCFLHEMGPDLWKFARLIRKAMGS